MGQIETDELYVAVRNTGQQFVVPVQAKGGTDQLGVVQVQQDLALCRHAFPHLTARPLALQVKKEERGGGIIMFEVVEDGDEGEEVDEEHYRLVSAHGTHPGEPENIARASGRPA